MSTYTYTYDQPYNVPDNLAAVEAQLFERYNSEVACRLDSTKAGADKTKAVQIIRRFITKLTHEQTQTAKMHDKLMDMKLAGPLSELAIAYDAYGWAILELGRLADRLQADG